MKHFSENPKPLHMQTMVVNSREEAFQASRGLKDVCLVWLPSAVEAEVGQPLENLTPLIQSIANNLGRQATLIILGETIDLVEVMSGITGWRYQAWIAIKSQIAQMAHSNHLPRQHFGALVLTAYPSALKHKKTRIHYTFCPACDRTTKDYGGKKHVYHEAGTLLSDVWKDTPSALSGELTEVLERLRDFFGIDLYHTFTILDCRHVEISRPPRQSISWTFAEAPLPSELTNQILQGDCLHSLKQIPTNSIDFAFADPPYNLGKNYSGYSDDLKIQDYFQWCDQWIEELARVLKPGRTLALLNIPLWSVRHFLYMQTILTFQNWIVWDALAFPVRLMMPAHYAILCFTKGTARSLPGLQRGAFAPRLPSDPPAFQALQPLADGYCLRRDCLQQRTRGSFQDRTLMTDLWSDIHRLKHNTRRVDHPCQLPPHLMSRLILLFTQPEEIVLDCFNGAGTSTLTAHQLGRKYLGLEASGEYCQMAQSRHEEIQQGLDPFRKQNRELISKNSRIRRMPKQTYQISKKTLQLEVRRIALSLNHLPTREELALYSQYPLEYYDQYFLHWGEVYAAVKTQGMKETRAASPTSPFLSSEPVSKTIQLHFFEGE